MRESIMLPTTLCAVDHRNCYINEGDESQEDAREDECQTEKQDTPIALDKNNSIVRGEILEETATQSHIMDSDCLSKSSDSCERSRDRKRRKTTDDVASDFETLDEANDSGSGTITTRSPSPVKEVTDLVEDLASNDDADCFDASALRDVQWDWLGTSLFCVEQNLVDQKMGRLQALIEQQSFATIQSQACPYDPMSLLTAAYLNNKLGFPDIGASQAYRSLILINAALTPKSMPSSTVNLRLLAQKAVCDRMNSQTPSIIMDEFLSLRLQAYTTICAALRDCGSFCEGLRWVKRGLKLFPNNTTLRMLYEKFSDDIEHRMMVMNIGTNETGGPATKQKGLLCRRKYPWIDPKLYIRTSTLLRDINQSHKWRKCKVQQISFDSTMTKNAKVEINDEQDLAGLGVFATKKIKKGDLVLVDRSILCASDIPPSSFEHCDACHATLAAPYVGPHSIVKPACCRKVAFCSTVCHDQAMKSYHKAICGNDFDWLFKDIEFETEEKISSRWKAILFLRLMVIILTDNEKRAPSQRWHPLNHPLVNRMTAAYVPEGVIHSTNPYEWTLKEDVSIPTKILLQLGVDIYGAQSEYSPEVIQTIFWRIENNANLSKNGLIPGKEVQMSCLNPHYLFLNHSCEPNLLWYSSIPDRDTSVKHLMGMDGEIMQPGESAVWCYAARDIKRGEELKISYVADPLGTKSTPRREKRAQLNKWFENGCGCKVCERENRKEKELENNNEC